ncbi:hypothetical protein NIES593_04495 [Hydrococcus rivularis NIES-593]|uniref:Uncharacterized protein n=1 Tax=Hydrococcus rivularis NIES-593 TaxID=1921803 RepID=A0A1U7HPX0_9CYAN|nr:hypothetical protein NIES593_04495 [Hydrococcus rivularis NIES-593]
MTRLKKKKDKKIIKEFKNSENLGNSIYRFQMGSANIKTLNIIKINKKMESASSGISKDGSGAF